MSIQDKRLVGLMDNILNRIGDHLVNEVEVSCNKSEWLKRKINGIEPLQTKTLSCDLNLAKHVYLVYKEIENPKFTISPNTNHLMFYPGRKYSINYKATMEKGILGDLYFISYAKGKKIQQISITPGHEKIISIHPD